MVNISLLVATHYSAVDESDGKPDILYKCCTEVTLISISINPNFLHIVNFSHLIYIRFIVYLATKHYQYPLNNYVMHF